MTRFLQRNFLLFLGGATVLSIPMPMLILLGGLAGVQLAPDPGLATLPTSVQILAGLFTVAPMSVFMGRFGRKIGFLAAAVFAILGGLLGAVSLLSGSFLLLCAAHFLLGIAVVSFGLFRFAATELVGPAHQAQAISLTLGIGLVAAVVAPEVFRAFRDSLAPVPFAGAYLAVSGIAALGVLPLMTVRFAAPAPAAMTRQPWSARLRLLRRPPILASMICAAGSFAGMSLMMTPTPLAMVGCGFLDLQAGDVIRWHVVAMFLPSFFTGALIARFGAARIAATGGGFLVLAAAVAMTGLELQHFYLSLILLGVGWNFGFIGASTILNAELSAADKPLVQGLNDSFVAGAAALASFASAGLVAGFGWGMVALVLVGFALVVVVSAACAHFAALRPLPLEPSG